MNVLNIPKQADHELIYRRHAIDRANEKDVPLPKYLPFGAKFVETRYVKGDLRYRFSYTYNNFEYFIVISETGRVVTVYPLDEQIEEKTISSAIAKLRARMNSSMVASDQYICFDYETDYQFYQQCA